VGPEVAENVALITDAVAVEHLPELHVLRVMIDITEKARSFSTPPLNPEIFLAAFSRATFSMDSSTAVHSGMPAKRNREA